jgi:mannose/cellobiose epimerase-like protein (N-acyl-D-glucosamine 2-epimerase family)
VPEVLADADGIASFVTTRLWRSPGFIPEGFSAGWRVPEENATGVHVVIGRQAEWAFLLSHGVELGLSPRYLRFGHKLMDYAMQNGYDDEKGGLGEPPSRQAKESWQQAEFLRALVRYADRHGSTEFWAPAEKTRQLIQSDFIDPVHGGWPDRTTGDKGSEWHWGYHEVGMYLEGMRVAKRRGNHE